MCYITLRSSPFPIQIFHIYTPFPNPTPLPLYSTHRENSRDVQLEFIVSQRIGENGLFVYIFSMWKNKVTQPLCQEV